jgi:2-iminobutanoate/2-iminopropanoate deaminase
MLITKYDTGISKHIGNYSDAVVVGPNGRWFQTSGTPGIDKDGNVPDGIEAQAELAWKNVFAAITAAGMKPTNLVKTTSYVKRIEDVQAFVKVKAKWLGDIRPAQMLLLTPGFINPKFLVEVEAIAVAE